MSCEQLINFVDHLVESIGILVKGGNPQKITGPSSLCGKNVTDSVGTTQESYRQSLNATGGLCASNPIHEVLASSTAQELANLTTGRADVVLNDNITDAFDAPTMRGAVTAVNYLPIQSGPYGIEMGTSDIRLLKAVNGALQNLMKGGSHSTCQETLSVWNVAPSEAPPLPRLSDGVAEKLVVGPQ